MGQAVRSLVAATAACLLLPLAATAAAGAGTDAGWRAVPDGRVAGSAADPGHAPDQLLVRYRAGTTAAERADVRSDFGAELLDRLPVPRLEVLHVEGDARGKARALERRPDVLSAEPNYRRTALVEPEDPHFTTLWGLHNLGQAVGSAGSLDADIDAPEAWETTTGDAGVTVAVVDTGVAAGHPDLVSNIWTNADEIAGNGRDDDDNGYVDDRYGFDWVDQDASPADLHDHGTHVAGTIGASGDNGVGTTGVAWTVSLMPLRVLDAEGSGWDSDIIEAFAYAGGNGADVVNASLGGPGHNRLMADAIAAYPDTLFVVAAGNDGSDNDTAGSYPCNYPAENLICVAATDNTDRLAEFSNYGDTSVDLGAPGAWIASTVPGTYAWMSGTSMASPHVAGAAALLFAADPAASAAEVRNALLGGVDQLSSLSGKTVTDGRLNVRNALDLLLAGRHAEPLPPADTAPLETTIVTAPPATTTARTATLRFSASEEDTSYTCSLDGEPFTACTSPVEYPGLTPGAHDFAVRAQDAAGNVDPTPAHHRWTVGNSAPTDVRVGGFPAPVTMRTRLLLRLSAHDADDAIDHFELRHRAARYDGAFDVWSTLDASVAAGSRPQVSVPTGHTVCYAARATDVHGATSAWGARRCTAVPVDDRGLTRGTGWNRTADAGAYRGTLSAASRQGATLTVAGAAVRRIALVATKSPGSGTVDVYLGRTLLRRVALAAPTTRKRQVVPVATWAAARTGDVRVVVRTSGKPVRVDGLVLGR